MNKIQILQELHNTANQLEKKGLYAEANVLTNVMTRVAQQQPQQAPQPGQRSARKLTEQDYDKHNKLYVELKRYRNKYEILFNYSYSKITSGKLLEETNNVPNASIMLQQILDYIMNLYNQMDAIYKIDGIDAQDQQVISSHKPFYDRRKAEIESLTRLHKTLKSSILPQAK
jgi:hypothetical protein